MEENNDGSLEKLLGSTSEKSVTRRGRRAGVVTARGTADGLVIRVDGRVEDGAVEPALREFLTARQGFLKGGKVLLEWIGGVPPEGTRERLLQVAREEFQIEIVDSGASVAELVSPSRLAGGGVSGGSGESRKGVMREFSGESEELGPLSLFDGIGAVEFDDSTAQAGGIERSLGVGQLQQGVWDDPDARIIYGTLRSGQKIESDHSLVIFGDVNSGAELVAGGDIIVLGTLRGVAHAGAYDETGGGRVIFALDLQPTQLRIGTVISRGTSEGATKGAELARVEGDIVVVEGFPVKQSARRTGGFSFLRQ